MSEVWCCKCNGIFCRWADPQPPVYIDNDGQGYCVFHAPADAKFKTLGGPLLTTSEFDGVVRERMRKSKRSESLECDFRGTIFPDGLTLGSFQREVFQPRLRFDECIFLGPFISDGMTLPSGASFDFAEFKGSVFVARTTFGGEVDFTGIRYDKEIHLRETKFEKLVRLSPQIGKDDTIIVHNCSASSVHNLLFESDAVRAIVFKGISQWPQTLGLETHPKSLATPKDIEELYRAMKQKASEGHDQPQVSHWHYREKLMMMKRGGDGAFERILLYLYWAFSGFGERAVRSSVWLTTFVFLPLLLFTVVQVARSGLSWTFDAAAVTEVFTDWQRALPLSKVPSDPPPAAWKLWVCYLSQLVITVQAALFGFAVRNRFRR